MGDAEPGCWTARARAKRESWVKTRAGKARVEMQVVEANGKVEEPPTEVPVCRPMAEPREEPWWCLARWNQGTMDLRQCGRWRLSQS